MKGGGTDGLLRVGDEDVEAVHLSLLERVGVVAIATLLLGRERDDTLLGLDRVLLVLHPTSRVSSPSSRLLFEAPTRTW